MNTPAPSYFIGSSFLQVIRKCINAWMSFNFGQIPPPTMELATIERLKINNVLNTFVIGFSSFLPVTRTTIEALMSSNLSQIRHWTTELAAVERLEKSL